MSLTADTRSRIEKIVTDNRIVLFMKGNRSQPQCGFSARAIGILLDIGEDFQTVDVLSDPEIRSGIKDFSEWPTIPQLYIDREFVGGSDIVSQMASSGDLHKMLGVDYVTPTAPVITLTDAMVVALKEYSASSGGYPRLEVSPRFEYGIGFGPKVDGDFAVESNGMTLLVDRGSAKRADGMTLDYQPGSGGGVIIDNPNEPPGVEQIDAFQLKEMLSKGEITLFDVRTPQEQETASIAGAIALDRPGMEKLAALDRATPIAFHCHHGVRSQQAAEYYLSQGYKKVYNVSGGIDAWSLNIDSGVARY
ncbi:MAG: monothiol glutaredoxin [Myxococcota bacterium]|jgi:monothiol glutaredoxin